MEMSKVYEPKCFERKLYDNWEKSGYFKAEISKDKIPFTIIMPPPNITGQLHMGHALNNTLQDVIIRFKRMLGFSALWVPGTDHASIATELKIVDSLKAEGIDKAELGREGFLKKAWEWTEKYGNRITDQIRSLGCSCDFSRLAFTMDKQRTEAVVDVFIKLYKKGLIYRGDRIINWCPSCRTALSDAEVDYSEEKSSLWHIKYQNDDGDYLIVATTRPETMLGDTAVAVNPNDKRYKHLIGKMLNLPLVDRKIPVIADSYVDESFGTGAVKITPAHDANDFEIGIRHNLPSIKIMDEGGVICDSGKYFGLDRYVAREKIVSDLKKLGYLVRVEKYDHNVGQCYRCDSAVEPMVSKQWFVKMQPLAKPAIDVVLKKKIKFIPERFSKTYFNWMENIKDWCISRQLWWGHRIPAYYCQDCNYTIVQKTLPKSCPKCNSQNIKQDEDVLDTWFSSALWPFSTLGFPKNNKDLDYFYPTNVLVTAYDIIFFWVARMIFSGLEHMQRIPFDEVLIHGIVRDSDGRKMSKSLGNGIDPLELIEKYGADTLRFSLINGISPGGDTRFMQDKVEGCKNFMNKIWNASKFVLTNCKDIKGDISGIRLSIADRWILTKLNGVVREVSKYMEKYELGLACNKLYEFVWNDFCDWYIEITKTHLYGDDKVKKNSASRVLVYLLTNILKLLHPFIPFITEEIYLSIKGSGKSIMLESYPRYNSKQNFRKDSKDFEMVMDLIRKIRTIKADVNCPPSKKINLYIKTDFKTIFNKSNDYIMRLVNAESINFVDDKNTIDGKFATYINPICEVFIPLGDMVDFEKEKKRLNAELERVEGEIARASSKLINRGFLDKAPKQLIEKEREKLNSYIELKEKISKELKDLN